MDAEMSNTGIYYICASGAHNIYCIPPNILHRTVLLLLYVEESEVHRGWLYSWWGLLLFLCFPLSSTVHSNPRGVFEPWPGANKAHVPFITTATLTAFKKSIPLSHWRSSPRAEWQLGCCREGSGRRFSEKLKKMTARDVYRWGIDDAEQNKPQPVAPMRVNESLAVNAKQNTIGCLICHFILKLGLIWIDYTIFVFEYTRK